MENRDKIAECIRKVDSLTTIAFVCKASNNRLTDTSKFIANVLLQMFGQDSEKNFTLLCTFSDNKKPQALKAAQEARIPVDRFFRFNNSAVFPDVGSEGGKDNELEYDVGDIFTELFWKMNEETNQVFF